MLFLRIVFAMHISKDNIKIGAAKYYNAIKTLTCAMTRKNYFEECQENKRRNPIFIVYHLLMFSLRLGCL